MRLAMVSNQLAAGLSKLDLRWYFLLDVISAIHPSIHPSMHPCHAPSISPMGAHANAAHLFY